MFTCKHLHTRKDVLHMNNESPICSDKIIATKIKEIIINLREKTPIRGCSDEELDLLESTLNIVLPEAYRVFLQFFGHGDGGGYFFDDTEWTYDNIIDSTFLARELLNESCENHPELSQEFIVVASLYNEYFYLLSTSNEKHNVYLWNRTTDEILSTYDSLWDLVIPVEWALLMN
jgi:SMI1 / KNR4 family (SUKH-1)